MAQQPECIPDAAQLLKHWVSCSSSTWLTRAAEIPAIAARFPPVMINVGANKGYNAAEWLGLHNMLVGVTARRWHRALQQYARNGTGRPHKFLLGQSCGACGGCRQPDPPMHKRQDGRVHMLELTSQNRELLRALVSAFHLPERIAKVHDLAASNQTQFVTEPDAFAGFEGASIVRVVKGTARTARRIEAVALDDFFARERLERVYAVEIDTEGVDALVLEGMRAALEAQRVGFVEFEYSHKGYWKEQRREARSLESVVGWLRERAGYTCFMEAGQWLAPISGPCWLATFRSHTKWSNVLCAAEPHALGLLHNLSWEGYHTRANKKRWRRDGGR